LRHIAEPLTEEELQEKEELIAQGFEDWSRRDFQQFVRALESYGWYVGRWSYAEFLADMAHRTEDFDLLASEIQDKTAQHVAAYYPVFRKKWKELSGKGLGSIRCPYSH
jgi:SWI/SNF-related matrix-associated actin-dependent regulator of chromatin subfamily A member 5